MGSNHVDTKATMNELEKELSNIVGLKQLKQQLRTWAKGLVMDEKRRQLGIKVCPKKPPHMAFLGNPGVGKTSMARILGKFLNNFGILPSNRVVEVQRSDLVAKYIGQTGPKTQEKIKEAEGGILFVDEAYRLIVPESRVDFGKEALEELMHAMESGKLSIIFAGYIEAMKPVFDSNEGFRRRLTTCFVFEDYSCSELAQILHLKMNGDLYCGYRLSPSCSISTIAKLLDRNTSEEQRSKMNGGLIDQVLTKAKESLNQRLDVNCVGIYQLTTIMLADLIASFALLNQTYFDGFQDNVPLVPRSSNPKGRDMPTSGTNLSIIKASLKSYFVIVVATTTCVVILRRI